MPIDSNERFISVCKSHGWLQRLSSENKIASGPLFAGYTLSIREKTAYVNLPIDDRLKTLKMQEIETKTVNSLMLENLPTEDRFKSLKNVEKPKLLQLKGLVQSHLPWDDSNVSRLIHRT